MKLRDRIKTLRRIPASEIQPNPRNWRTHPQAQQDALRGVLAEVGIADACLVRELPDGGVELVDGHLRVDTMPDQKIPCLVLDVTEAEADLILATLDPLAAMAETDPVKLDELLREVQTSSQAVADMLEGLAEDAGILDGEEPFAGAKYNPRAKQWDGIENDKLQGGDLETFVKSVLDAWLPIMNKQAAFYFWTAAMQEGAAAAAAIRDAGLHIQSQIIWNKNCLVLGQADYHWKHENCWYAFLKGEKHRWFGERKQTTVWDVAKVANSEYAHPMQKPVELYAIPIRNHTKAEEVIAEPFSGSGTTIIACEQLGRKCRAIEISPAYCDVAVKRWENLTGSKATRA